MKEILLIDDDAVTNFINQTILESKMPGVPIKFFYNGSIAMEYILEFPEKQYLVFLDLNMPVMSGWEFIRAMESLESKLHIEIHILTSSIDPEDKLKARNFTGVSSFMEKPLDESVLELLLLNTIKKDS